MKKLVFSLIATVFMGVLSASAIGGPNGYFRLPGLGFGKVSSYAGPCVPATGMCSGTISDEPTMFNAGVMKINETMVSFAFSREFYEENQQYLKNGLVVGESYSLPQSVSQKLGLNGEFIVARGTYPVTEKDGYFFVSVSRVK